MINPSNPSDSGGRPRAYSSLLSALVAIGLLAAPTSSSAQEASPEPVQSSTGSATAGEPGGVWFSGGFSLLADGGSLAGMRADVGIPLTDKIPISIVLPVSFHGRRDNLGFGTGRIRSRFFTFLPGVNFEFMLPIDIPGDLSVVGEFGAGIAIANVRVSGSSDTEARFGMRFAAHARYYFEGAPALFVFVQPAGGLFVFTDGPGDLRAFEFWIGGGYRFGR